MSAKDGTIKYHYSPNQFSHNFQIYGLERRMFPQALKTAGNERQASPSLPLSPPPKKKIKTKEASSYSPTLHVTHTSLQSSTTETHF